MLCSGLTISLYKAIVISRSHWILIGILPKVYPFQFPFGLFLLVWHHLLLKCQPSFWICSETIAFNQKKHLLSLIVKDDSYYGIHFPKKKLPLTVGEKGRKVNEKRRITFSIHLWGLLDKAENRGKMSSLFTTCRVVFESSHYFRQTLLYITLLSANVEIFVYIHRILTSVEHLIN